MSSSDLVSPDRIHLLSQRLTRLSALSPPLRACIVADIKRTAGRRATPLPGHRVRKGHHCRRATLCALAAMTFLSSCGTPVPPAPPTIDAAQRRPANDPLELENRRSRIQLHNERLKQQLSEQRAQLEAMSSPIALQQPVAPAGPPPPEQQKANQVYVVTYAHAKSDVAMAADQEHELLAAARIALHIVIRGRTDGRADTAGEARIARERAERMKDFLITAGVDPNKVRVTYQPSGDHFASNTSDDGKALNRRVEVELYPTPPSVQVLERRNKTST